MSHTPGPWDADVSIAYTLPDKAPFFQVTARGSAYWVAYVQDSPNGLGTANANLIAAAPDLLEALKGMREHAEHSTPQGFAAFRQAEAAIAKAEGK